MCWRMRTMAIGVIVGLSMTVVFIAPAGCQLLSSSSSSLDLLSDSFRAMLGLNQMLSTIKKVSSGVIPFPFFVPLMSRSEVFRLLGVKGKKSKKAKQQPKQNKVTVTPVSQMIPVAVPPPPGLQPAFAASNNYHHYDPNPFYNFRPFFGLPTNPPFVLSDPPMGDEIKDNDLEINNYDFSNGNADNSDGYSERFEMVLQPEIRTSDIEEDSGEPENVRPTDQLNQNWDTIDEELRKIGYRLGELGSILHSDRVNK